MRFLGFRTIALAAMLVTLHGAPSVAQTTIPVEFAAGAVSATVNGSVIGQDYADYVLGASAGQTMTVDLTVTGTNGDGVVYFNILPPGSDGEAIYNGSMDGRSASVELPQDGDYIVRVYLMGNDADTGKTVGFTIQVSID